MFHRVVAHEIEVDIRRHVDRVSLQPVRAVIDDVQVPREAVTLRIDRHESKVDARIAVHHDGIHDVVLVERHGKGGTERRNEAVEQQVHAVVIDIHVFEDCIDVLLERTL